jgi:hypothetical protein
MFMINIEKWLVVLSVSGGHQKEGTQKSPTRHKRTHTESPKTLSAFCHDQQLRNSSDESSRVIIPLNHLLSLMYRCVQKMAWKVSEMKQKKVKPGFLVYPFVPFMPFMPRLV